MQDNVKRPKRIWLIFIWFMWGGVISLYQVYEISTGNIELPPGVEQPSGILYYLQAVGFHVITIVAATLIFFRFSVNRWFFLFMSVVTILSLPFLIFSNAIPDQQFTAIILAMLFSLVIYVLITFYSFALLNSGYYKDTHNKSSNADAQKARADY